MDIHMGDFQLYQLFFNIMSSLFTCVLVLGTFSFFFTELPKSVVFLFSECLPVCTWQQWQVWRATVNQKIVLHKLHKAPMQSIFKWWPNTFSSASSIPFLNQSLHFYWQQFFFICYAIAYQTLRDIMLMWLIFMCCCCLGSVWQVNDLSAPQRLLN